MSLSAYLSQTLIFTTVFYGYGLGVAYSWGPTQVVLLSVVIYAGQLLLCHWWQARYRRGPAEWLWRSLTLWRWGLYAPGSKPNQLVCGVGLPA